MSAWAVHNIIELACQRWNHLPSKFVLYEIIKCLYCFASIASVLLLLLKAFLGFNNTYTPVPPASRTLYSYFGCTFPHIGTKDISNSVGNFYLVYNELIQYIYSQILFSVNTHTHTHTHTHSCLPYAACLVGSSCISYLS